MFVRAGGRRLEYRVIAGNESKPTLLFMHHGLGCVSTWRDVPDVIAARTGCRAVLYSRWGHGASEPSARPRGVRFMHDEAQRVLPELLDALKIDNPILIGHSDGASIALIHAGGHVRPVRALVLLAPHVFVEDCSVASIANIRQRYQATNLRERLWRHHGDNVDGAFHGWTDVWLDPAFREWNIEHYLGGIGVPTLIVQGEDDEYGTARQAEAVAAQVKGEVEVMMLPQCGHAPHRDQREIVVQRLVAFIATTGDRAAAPGRSAHPVRALRSEPDSA
jgi:pimeloyl-ACP methyl ester carboxylesterase